MIPKLSTTLEARLPEYLPDVNAGVLEEDGEEQQNLFFNEEDLDGDLSN